MSDASEVYKILKDKVGVENAIKAKELTEHFGKKDEDTHSSARTIIRKVAKEYNLPVVSHPSHGYYIPANDKELNEYMSRENQRMRKIIDRSEKVKKDYYALKGEDVEVVSEINYDDNDDED
jgi:hypothetical protein